MAGLGLLILSILPTWSIAFANPRTISFLGHSSGISANAVLSCPHKDAPSGLNMAAGKKMRRRRKNPRPSPDKTSAEEVENNPALDDYGELPDFDLDDEPVATPSKVSAASGAAPAPSSIGSDTSVMEAAEVDLADPRTLEAMRGGKRIGTMKSTGELISDRSLEKAFQFENSEDALPALGKIVDKGGGGSGVVESGEARVGKKYARSEARRAAAIEAEEADKDESGFFSGISLDVGEISPIKVRAMAIIVSPH